MRRLAVYASSTLRPPKESAIRDSVAPILCAEPRGKRLHPYGL